MLSEHTMEEMLEGHLLTGRHGFLSFYEAVSGKQLHLQYMDMDAAI
jgi:phosphoketolase